MYYKKEFIHLRAYTEVSTDMSKRKPTYARHYVIRYESETEYPEWARGPAQSLRQELEAPQFEVEPQCDSDSRYVSFCQLLGYQREELVGKRYDDLTAPNTNDIPTVFGLFQKLGYINACMVCGCSLVVKVPAFWFDMKHGFGLTPTSKGTWRS
jgi:hypothetical protein